MLSQEDMRAIDTITGEKGEHWKHGDPLRGEAYKTVSEKFAHGLEKFLRDENPTGFSAEVKKVLAKVKEMLKQAGYAGEKVSMLVATDYAQFKAIGDVAADMMGQVGMNVDYVATDWGTMLQRRNNKGPVDQGGWNLFVTNATVTGISNPLLDNYVKHCDSAW